MCSLHDGFSGYNQVLVSHFDQLKTTFRTKWGTYAYQNMHFGLINTSATFKRVMDIAFKGLINKSVVVYLDDVIVFSKRKKRLSFTYQAIFLSMPKVWSFSQPKKKNFAVTKGKLLRFIVSKYRMIIELEIIEAISRIAYPHNKKSM